VIVPHFITVCVICKQKIIALEMTFSCTVGHNIIILDGFFMFLYCSLILKLAKVMSYNYSSFSVIV
jgi:hypothetical protein